MQQLNRITQQPDIMGGKACIRGMRVTVGMVVGQIGAGYSIDEVLSDYPYLEREDILQALQYGAWQAQGSDDSVALLSMFDDVRDKTSAAKEWDRLNNLPAE